MNTLDVIASGEREIVITREFAAPRELVFDALTKPELLMRWHGARGWNLVECEIDLREGGSWRHVSHGPDGQTMAMSGVYRVIVVPERLVTTQLHECEDTKGKEHLVTTTLSEKDGRTLLRSVTLYPTREIRDAVTRSGMRRGTAESYVMLDELLANRG